MPVQVNTKIWKAAYGRQPLGVRRWRWHIGGAIYESPRMPFFEAQTWARLKAAELGEAHTTLAVDNADRLLYAAIMLDKEARGRRRTR